MMPVHGVSDPCPVRPGNSAPADRAQGSALQGVRVLDLSRVLAGPWATQLLADLGADVIKIERPGSGDETRDWGPPWLRSPDGSRRQSAYFLAANRGKRSMCVDLAAPEGRDLVRSLATRCDVLVENFRTGVLAAWGLDYASLSASHPHLVYCSITGFGQSGPYAERPGYDFLVQGMGGLMSVTGTPGGEPLKVGVALGDILTGLYAANAILAAIHQRGSTGQGQHVEVALLDSVVAALANQATGFLVTGEEPPRLGNAHPSIVPYDLFTTADGHLILAVGNDAQFARCCAVLGFPEVAEDERFRRNSDRVTHRVALTELLGARLRGASTAHWLAAMEAAGVPAGPVHSLREVFADPQVVHRGMRLELNDEHFGRVPGVAAPIRLSHSPVASMRAPPALGAHTRQLLREFLDHSPARIDDLVSRGIVA